MKSESQDRDQDYGFQRGLISEDNYQPLIDSWTKPLRGRFKASIARAMQDGQKLIS